MKVIKDVTFAGRLEGYYAPQFCATWNNVHKMNK